MDLKTKILGSILALIVAFAAGRYTSGPDSTKTEVKVSETKDKKEEKDKQTKRVTVTTKSPNGEVKTVTTVDTISKTKIAEETTKDSSSKTSTKRSTLNVSALAGYNFKEPTTQPLYGISVSKQFLGPITGGAWGLSNGTVGISLGLEF